VWFLLQIERVVGNRGRHGGLRAIGSICVAGFSSFLSCRRYIGVV